MKRVILTYPLGIVQIHEELAFFAQYFRGLGYEHCEVLFGFAWGNEYYPGPEWLPIRLPLGSLVQKVQQVEAARLGWLGTDDLFVTIPRLALEFRFCNDADIRIDFDEPNEITEFFYQRWNSSGYTPSEWICDQNGKPTEQLRSN